MKRFLLFAFDQYYPSGGMNDFIKDFDTLIEAYRTSLQHRQDFKQIYDSEKREVIEIDKLIEKSILDYI